MESQVPFCHRSRLKAVVSAGTRAAVGRNLTNEVEFYLWCRQRLHTMYHTLVRDKALP